VCFSEGGLRKHFKEEHEEIQRCCRRCELYFQTKADMKRHMNTIHGDGD